MEKNDYKNISNFAKSKNVNLSGVKKFKGSPAVVNDSVTFLANINNIFPNISVNNKKLTLNLGESMSKKDFAATNGRIISLNKDYYHNIDILQSEYKKLADNGWFVKGTDYRAIIYHESGHVIDEIYKIDSLKIACEITGLESKKILEFVKTDLSAYAASDKYGNEIISEVFADIFSGNASKFSKEFYKKVLEITRTDKNK